MGTIALTTGTRRRLQLPYPFPRRALFRATRWETSVDQLNEAGEYEGKQFRGQQPIESAVFPELHPTLDQILTSIR